MRLPDDNKVVAVACVPHDDEEPSEKLDSSEPLELETETSEDITEN